MPNNTDAQRERRRDAIVSACFYTLLALLGSAVTLAIRQHFGLTGFVGLLLLITGLLDLGIIIPIWIVLKMRIKEINGGEEDAATQY